MKQTNSHRPVPKGRGLKFALIGAGMAAMIAVGGTSLAQDTVNAKRHHFNPAEKMAELLSLDDAQKSKVEAVFERNRPAMKSIRERSKANRTALHGLDASSADYGRQYQALADEAASIARDRVLHHGQLQSDLAVVLTPEQMAKMKEARANRRGKHGHRHHRKSEQSES